VPAGITTKKHSVLQIRPVLKCAVITIAKPAPYLHSKNTHN